MSFHFLKTRIFSEIGIFHETHVLRKNVDYFEQTRLIVISRLKATIDVLAKIRISTDNLVFQRGEMAYQNASLEHRLDWVEASARRVLEAATLDIGTRQADEIWWPFLVQTYGKEEAIFTRTRIDKALLKVSTRLFVTFPSRAAERRGRFGRRARSSSWISR